MHIQTFREELAPILPKLFQTIAEGGMLPSSLYETTLTLIPKPEEDTAQNGNYRPVSLMNTEAKTCNKILANQIKQCIKRTVHMIKRDLSWGYNDFSISANQSM